MSTSHHNTHSSRKVAWVALALALVLLAIIGIAAYVSTRRLVASEQSVAHTREVQTLLEDLRSDILEAENSRRGYIVVGNEAQLSPYYRAMQDIPTKLGSLEALVASGHQAQRERLQNLRSQIDREFEILQGSVDLRRKGRPNLREEIDITRASDAADSRIVNLIQQMKQEESATLAERRQAADRNYKGTVRVLAAAFLLALVLILINFMRLQKELRQRELAEHAALESEHLIHAFFSSSTVGFAILDSDLRYRRINAEMANMAAMQPEEFLGKTMTQIFGPAAEQGEAALRKVMETGQAVLDRATSGTVPGGGRAVRHWMVNYFPIRSSSGEITRLGIISLDVTARKSAEQAYRRLSSRLLKLQDEERRRIAREMHDSLGQYLTALKISLEMMPRVPEAQREALLEDAVATTDQCLSETRTLSHLLHPPLLDEAGFASAARWFVNGFAQRSGIDVNLEMPEDFGRLSRPVETTLFRVLQESLTNIHRHSKSQSADIHFSVHESTVTLEVRDYGRGIDESLLERFHENEAQTGVGLAGMRERVHELGGTLEMRREQRGTRVIATVPVASAEERSERAIPRRVDSSAA
jgi:PAS domain S-box-containing protein